MDRSYSHNGFQSFVDSSAARPFSMDCIEIITTDDALHRLVEYLRGRNKLAVDTESNGFYAYHEKTCLIQLSDGTKNYIIDPLTIKDCSVLGELFSDSGIEKILHHAVNDISGLRNDFGFTFSCLFDTYVACRILGIKRLGLASLLGSYLRVTINKRGQHYDWSHRPIDKDRLIYAAMDVFYLIPLAERIKRELSDRGLLERAYELSQAVALRIVPKRRFPERGYANISGYGNLSEAEKKIVKRIYKFRDEVAKQWDRAPFRVLNNETILKIAITKPLTLEDLENIKGVPAKFQRGHLGERLIQIVGDAIKC
ncbi:MAG: HRDC domain-containing protein [Syntrophobacterales bacterium]|nr:HRDC domain-containing protein [Syntrophobacterales bacterium]